jgi:hypothetical protein
VLPAVLLEAGRDLAVFASFRALPVIAALAASRRVRRWTRLAAAVAGAGLVAAGHTWGVLPVGTLAAAFAYLTAGACAVPLAARALRAGHLTRGAALVGAFGVFLLFPAAFWTLPMRAYALVLGWDLVLSAYSYCVEVAKQEHDPPLGDALFFLLVNPTLVYVRRGTEVGPPRPDARGLARALLGLTSVFGVSALIAPEVRALSGDRAPLAVAAFGVLRFLCEYGRHSGLASYQIGLMRQLGWELPERYVWPIAATSVPDFWRRWNTYIGQWALRYVFWPFGARVRRGLGRRSPAVAAAAGVVVTFAAVGVFHDAYDYAKGFTLQATMTLAFVANGVAVVAWAGIARLGVARRDGRARGLASRVCVWGAVVGGTIAWLR